MPKKLPARPHLEHLRTQAKALLARFRGGDAAAARLFAEHRPGATNYRLADAQAVVARQSGFAAWPALARHVELLRALEGTWAFRALETDGQAVPPAMLQHSRLLLDGDRFRMESPEATYEGTFLIDVEASPARIDIDFQEGPEAGNRCEGVFELDGDRLRFCLGLAGAARPASFATVPGSGHALEDLVRVEHARPYGVDGGRPAASLTPAPAVPSMSMEESAQDGPLSPTLQKLQGEWLCLELVTSGAPLSPDYLAYGLRTHTGTETKVVFGGQTMLHARIQVEEDTAPLAIDYLNLAGRAKGLDLPRPVPLGRRRGRLLYCRTRRSAASGLHERQRKRPDAQPLAAPRLTIHTPAIRPATRAQPTPPAPGSRATP